jgi:hypothetical protein
MSEQPNTDEQLQALRREFEEYWLTCLPLKRYWESEAAYKARCWRSWLYAKGGEEK